MLEYSTKWLDIIAFLLFSPSSPALGKVCLYFLVCWTTWHSDSRKGTCRHDTLSDRPPHGHTTHPLGSVRLHHLVVGHGVVEGLLLVDLVADPPALGDVLVDVGDLHPGDCLVDSPALPLPAGPGHCHVPGCYSWHRRRYSIYMGVTAGIGGVTASAWGATAGIGGVTASVLGVTVGI